MVTHPEGVLSHSCAHGCVRIYRGLAPQVAELLGIVLDCCSIRHWQCDSEWVELRLLHALEARECLTHVWCFLYRIKDEQILVDTRGVAPGIRDGVFTGDVGASFRSLGRVRPAQSSMSCHVEVSESARHVEGFVEIKVGAMT